MHSLAQFRFQNRIKWLKQLKKCLVRLSLTSFWTSWRKAFANIQRVNRQLILIMPEYVLFVDAGVLMSFSTRFLQQNGSGLNCATCLCSAINQPAYRSFPAVRKLYNTVKHYGWVVFKEDSRYWLCKACLAAARAEHQQVSVLAKLLASYGAAQAESSWIS